jgi:hypothetical protein
MDETKDSNVYYDPRIQLPTRIWIQLQQLWKAEKTRADLKQTLEAQNAYTLHKPVRKHCQRNPYTVNNLMDVWECDLVDVQSLGKYDNYKYLPTVINVFSKYLQVVPLKSKVGPTVTTAFRSIFKDPRYSKPIRRCPIWVRTNKGKEFLNKTFQDMLKQEGIQF